MRGEDRDEHKDEEGEMARTNATSGGDVVTGSVLWYAPRRIAKESFGKKSRLSPGLPRLLPDLPGVFQDLLEPQKGAQTVPERH